MLKIQISWYVIFDQKFDEVPKIFKILVLIIDSFPRFPGLASFSFTIFFSF